MILREYRVCMVIPKETTASNKRLVSNGENALDAVVEVITPYYQTHKKLPPLILKWAVDADMTKQQCGYGGTLGYTIRFAVGEAFINKNKPVFDEFEQAFAKMAQLSITRSPDKGKKLVGDALSMALVIESRNGFHLPCLPHVVFRSMEFNGRRVKHRTKTVFETIKVIAEPIRAVKPEQRGETWH